MKKVIFSLIILGGFIFTSCSKQEVVKTNKEERVYVPVQNNPEQVTDPVPTNRSRIVDPRDPNNDPDPKPTSPKKPKH